MLLFFAQIHTLDLSLPFSFNLLQGLYTFQAMAKKLTFLFYLTIIMVAILAHYKASSTLLPATQLQPQGNNQMYGTTQGSLHPQECAPKCTSRCSKTSFKKPCMFFCQKCCAKCLCVPPGTYGNKQVCPCYNNWKTKRGGPKCP